MTPRLQEAQQQNVQELRRLMHREVEQVHAPRPWGGVIIAVIAGITLAAGMATCHHEHEATAAYRSQPSADVRQMSEARRDIQAEQEELIRREYGKIVGVKP